MATEQTVSDSTSAKPLTEPSSIFAIRNVHTDHDRPGQILSLLCGDWVCNSDGYTYKETWTNEANPKETWTDEKLPVVVRTKWKDSELIKKVQIKFIPGRRNGGLIARLKVVEKSSDTEPTNDVGTITDEESGKATRLTFIFDPNQQKKSLRYRLLDDKLELVE